MTRRKPKPKTFDAGLAKVLGQACIHRYVERKQWAETYNLAPKIFKSQRDFRKRVEEYQELELAGVKDDIVMQMHVRINERQALLIPAMKANSVKGINAHRLEDELRCQIMGLYAQQPLAPADVPVDTGPVVSLPTTIDPDAWVAEAKAYQLRVPRFEKS